MDASPGQFANHRPDQAQLTTRNNDVIEPFFGALKYEHLFRGVIADGGALDMEVHRFRIIYNTPAPGTRRPSAQYGLHRS
jgi:putative transposase